MVCTGKYIKLKVITHLLLTFNYCCTHNMYTDSTYLYYMVIYIKCLFYNSIINIMGCEVVRTFWFARWIQIADHFVVTELCSVQRGSVLLE